MNKPAKISEAAYRVLLLLKALNERPMSCDDIIELLSKTEIAAVESREVVSRYIATLRNAGYVIARPCLSNNNRYVLTKSPLRVNLDEEDFKAQRLIDKFMAFIYQDKLKQYSKEFDSRLFRFISEQDVQRLLAQRQKIFDEDSENVRIFKKKSVLISDIEKYCGDLQRIQITLKSGLKFLTILFEPEQIKYFSNNVYIYGINVDTGESQLINIRRITKIVQLPVKIKFNKVYQPVRFRLKGRLAKSYTPYEYESVIARDSSEITIVSAPYDKALLFRRLLRYGDNCEVISPVSDRNRMAELIKNALLNYVDAV